jgi:hypothetical protein
VITNVGILYPDTIAHEPTGKSMIDSVKLTFFESSTDGTGAYRCARHWAFMGEQSEDCMRGRVNNELKE